MRRPGEVATNSPSGETFEQPAIFGNETARATRIGQPDGLQRRCAEVNESVESLGQLRQVIDDLDLTAQQWAGPFHRFTTEAKQLEVRFQLNSLGEECRQNHAVAQLVSWLGKKCGPGRRHRGNDTGRQVPYGAS